MMMLSLETYSYDNKAKVFLKLFDKWDIQIWIKTTKCINIKIAA